MLRGSTYLPRGPRGAASPLAHVCIARWLAQAGTPRIALKLHIIPSPPAWMHDSNCGRKHHGLYFNKMALITSDCGKMRCLSIKWP